MFPSDSSSVTVAFGSVAAVIGGAAFYFLFKNIRASRREVTKPRQDSGGWISTGEPVYLHVFSKPSNKVVRNNKTSIRHDSSSCNTVCVSDPSGHEVDLSFEPSSLSDCSGCDDGPSYPDCGDTSDSGCCDFGCGD